MPKAQLPQADHADALAGAANLSKSRQLQLKVAAREAERLRIGQDLHDAFGGNLTGASLLLVKLASQFPDANAAQAETLQQLRELISDSQRNLQRIIQNLRPPELDAGLLPALRKLCQHWQSLSDLQIELRFAVEEVETEKAVEGVEVAHEIESVHLSPLEQGDASALAAAKYEENFNLALNAEQALALYRIAQEGLNNVARHAQATQVSLQLLHGKASMRLEIIDNGKAGGKKYHAGAGLTGMQERVAAFGGSLQYEVLDKSGHCLQVVLPLQAGD